MVVRQFTLRSGSADSRSAGVRNWWMLAVLFLLYMVSMINRQMMAILAPAMQLELRLSDFELGMLMGPAFAFLFAAFGLPLGWAADNLSRKWVIFAGCFLVGLATLGKGFAASFALMFALRAAVGAGEAALSPGAYSMIADHFPARRLSTAVSIYNTGLKIGISLSFLVSAGALLFGPLIRATFPWLSTLSDWRLAFVVVGIISMTAALLMLTVRDDRQPCVATPEAALVGLWAYFSAHCRTLMPLLAGFSLVSLASNNLIYWTPTYLERHFGLSAAAAGPILAMISLIAASTLVIKGLVIDHLFARGIVDAPIRFYSWLLAPCVLIGAILCFLPSATVFLVMNGIVQVVAVPFVAYSIAGVQLFVPTHLRGQMTALFLLAYNVFGTGLGPLSTGMLVQFIFGNPASLGYAIALINAMTLLPAFILIRRALPELKREILAARAAEQIPNNASSTDVHAMPERN